MVKLQALVFFVVCAGISNAGISIINNEVIDSYSNDCYGFKCSLTDASCLKRVETNARNKNLIDVSIACLNNAGQVMKSSLSQIPANNGGGFIGTVSSVSQHSINVNKEQEEANEAILNNVFSGLDNMFEGMFGSDFFD